MKLWAAFLVVVSAGCAATSAAHEMDLEVRTLEGGRLEGRLIYSDEAPAGGRYIRIEDLTDPGISMVFLQTGEDGVFRVPGLRGHRYAVMAEGDEGHATTVELVLSVQPPTAAGRTGWPPVYVLIGGLMLLSLIPARLLRAR